MEYTTQQVREIRTQDIPRIVTFLQRQVEGGLDYTVTNATTRLLRRQQDTIDSLNYVLERVYNQIDTLTNNLAVLEQRVQPVFAPEITATAAARAFDQTPVDTVLAVPLLPTAAAAPIERYTIPPVLQWLPDVATGSDLASEGDLSEDRDANPSDGYEDSEDDGPTQHMRV